jgi:hypothetical protein
MRGKEYSVEDYKKALQNISEKYKIHESHYKMLQEHYSAPERKLTPPQLADLVGYKNYNAINLQYGKLGKMICDELGYIPPHHRQGNPTWTCGLAWGYREDEESDWVWIMYENLAIALKNIGMVR